MNQIWKRRFMDIAELLATWSKDPSTKVGSVIVDHDRRLVGTGYNGFPRGVNDDEARYSEKSVKYKLIVHAEANSIMNAVKSVRDCTLVSTKFPCSECAKLIVQSGFWMVIAPPPSKDGVWADDAQFSRTLLTEGGVILEEWPG